MKTFKIVVYSALLVFHLSAIIIISVGRNDLNFLLDLFKRMDLMMYSAYVGLLLFLVLVFFEWRNQKNVQKIEKKHSKEINELKAKLYDKREAGSSSTSESASDSSKNTETSEEKRDDSEKESNS